MLKLFVCRICGEPYLGRKAPDDCPFCGAPMEYIGPVEEYSTLWGVKLTDQEGKDMKATLALEVNAAAYYNKVSDGQEKYSKHNRLFKQLARVEKEHAEVAAKFLGVKMPELAGEDSKGSVKAGLEKTRDLEANATEKYRSFLSNATNDNVKMFYRALIHAEQGHLDHVSAGL